MVCCFLWASHYELITTEANFAAAAAAPHSAGTPDSAGRQVSLVFTTSVILFTCCLAFSVPQGLSSVPGRRNGIWHFCHPGLVHRALSKSMTTLRVLFICCCDRLSETIGKLGSEAEFELSFVSDCEGLLCARESLPFLLEQTSFIYFHSFMLECFEFSCF